MLKYEVCVWQFNFFEEVAQKQEGYLFGWLFASIPVERIALCHHGFYQFK